MDKYKFYALLMSILFLSSTIAFLRIALKKGELYMIGTPIRRKEESGQFFVILIFISSVLGGFGLFWLFVCFHK